MADDPIGVVEWQEAADAARGALALDAARRFGLVDGGPEVNVERCEEILERAEKAYGVIPAADAIERFVAALSEERLHPPGAREWM